MINRSTLRIIAHDAEHMRRLGQQTGQSIHSGIIIKLIGDLGAGKTCFVQGLAKGLDVPEQYAVTSPTYTLINEFPGRLPLFHVDLYRIHSIEDAEAIGFWDIMTPNHVVVVEWADRITDTEWPPETLTLHFLTRDDGSRQIELFGSGLQTANLIKKIGSVGSEQNSASATTRKAGGLDCWVKGPKKQKNASDL